MTNEISQKEKIILDLTNGIILSDNKRFKEKGITFRVTLNTSQEDPYESKITVDLIYDDEIIDFIAFFVYEKGEFIINEDTFKNWLNETLNETYQNLIQYD
jgi:hypothetical protein